MLALIQRVNRASVSVDGETVSEIGKGLLVFLGIAHDEEEEDIRIFCDKLPKLRIFDDEKGKMNLSLRDISGEILLVSQFTLLASLERGLRPGFENARKPDEAERIYEEIAEKLTADGVIVKKGVFGAHMHVSLENDGPATFIFDTRKKRKSR
jgi:D-tyrosyl-tRNA(Tyr) deacylase